MVQRIIFGAIYAILAICLFLFASPFATGIIMCFVSVMAVTEFLKAVSLLDTKKLPLVIITYLFCILMSVVTIYSGIIYRNNGISSPFTDYNNLLISVIIYIIISFIIMVVYHDNISFGDISSSIIGNLYITTSLMHIYLIRSLPDGELYIWIPFLIAWFTDTFAYFTGFFIGKHKLIPKVSPKKTIEGSVGGIIGAIVIVVVYQYVGCKIYGLAPNYIKGAIIAVICSIASQFGDLAASCIKREHNVKDFGNIMPGHGGVLDRFDSVIYISPIVFLVLNYIKIF